MFLAKIVFAVFTCASLINNAFVAGQDDEESDDTEDQQPEQGEEKPSVPQDNHTFVALIDILFTNGRKRSCTGTIIHDNVVVTAAHCFIDPESYVVPELTASFVVIGTKKMFDTGYENYLPIERVITHPHYKGWTADIALVFTFAGMTSDKPGNIIPLVGERTMTPVDSNVTVLSWGHCKDEEPQFVTREPVSVDPTSLCDSLEDDSCEEKKAGRNGKMRLPLSTEENVEPLTPNHTEKTAHAKHNTGTGHGLRQDTKPVKNFPEHIYRKSTTPGLKEKTTKFMSRYLPTEKKSNMDRKRSEKTTSRHRYHKAKRNTDSDDDENIMIVITTDDMKFRFNKHNKSKHAQMEKSSYIDRTRRELERLAAARRQANNSDEPHPSNKSLELLTPEEASIQSYFKDWRRQIGTKENKLTVEIFGFVNVQTCKKMVEKAMPAIYAINPNHVACYATEEHYITDEDSGAPAIRQGHLVAVTVGGVSCEGDHVSIGMKMSCFCNWIAENLPDGGENMKCCKDCCAGGDKEEKKYYKHKNKYLYQ